MSRPIRRLRHHDVRTTALVVVLLDSTLLGTYPAPKLVIIMVTGYLLKVAYEALATPLTYLIVNWLKRVEHSDAFDAQTDFNPLHLVES